MGKITDYNFDLPQELIAKCPVQPRDACSLYVLHRSGALEVRQFRDLPEYLQPGDALVLNNTRVAPTQFLVTLPNGRQEQLVLASRKSRDVWDCWITTSRRPPRPGTRLTAVLRSKTRYPGDSRI